MKNRTPTLLATLEIAAILGIWECAGSPYFGLGIQTPFESAARYHLRMMYYHGRETKNGQDLDHGKQLVALGEHAVVPVVVDLLEAGEISPRYEPEPVEILKSFPRAAQFEMLRRLQEGLSPSRDKRFSDEKNRGIDLERRSCLIYGLIKVADDWDYLDQWIAEAQLPERDEWKNGLSAERINSLVIDRLEKLGAPRLLHMNHYADWSVNPEFETWWRDNRDRVECSTRRRLEITF